MTGGHVLDGKRTAPVRRVAAALVCTWGMFAASAAVAQSGEEVIVLGVRGELQRSLDFRQRDDRIVEAITAADIGRFSVPSVTSNVGLNNPSAPLDNRRFGPSIVRLDGFTFGASIQVPLVTDDDLFARMPQLRPRRNPLWGSLASFYASMDVTHASGSAFAVHPAGDQNVYTSLLYPQPGQFVVNPIFNLSPGQVGITVNLERQISIFDLEAGISFSEYTFTEDERLERAIDDLSGEWRFKPRIGLRGLHVNQRASSQANFTTLTNSFSNTDVTLIDNYLGLGLGGRFEIPVRPTEDRLPIMFYLDGAIGPALRFYNGQASQTSRCGDTITFNCPLFYGTDPINQQISTGGISLTYTAKLEAGVDFNIGPGAHLGVYGGLSHIGHVTSYNAPGPEANQPASFGSGPATSFGFGVRLKVDLPPVRDDLAFRSP